MEREVNQLGYFSTNQHMADMLATARAGPKFISSYFVSSANQYRFIEGKFYQSTKLNTYASFCKLVGLDNNSIKNNITINRAASQFKQPS